jgi:hypothetical protein
MMGMRGGNKCGERVRGSLYEVDLTGGKVGFCVVPDDHQRQWNTCGEREGSKSKRTSNLALSVSVSVRHYAGTTLLDTGQHGTSHRPHRNLSPVCGYVSIVRVSGAFKKHRAMVDFRTHFEPI